MNIHSRADVPGHDGNDLVSNPAEQISADWRILSVHSPSGDDIEPFVELGEKWRILAGSF